MDPARPPSPASATRPPTAPQLTNAQTQTQQGQKPPQPQPPQPSRVMPTSHLTGPPPGAAASTHVGNYTLYSTIGEGAFGRVKIGVHHHTNARVAIKIMDKDTIREQECTIQVRREIYVMRSLSHKHIVKLFEVLTSDTRLYIVMELVVGGELFELIRRNGPLPEHRARRFFQQLVDGVDFCHKRGVAHRDLKPENLLVDENGDLKITDFGFSSMKGFDANQGLMYTQCGTPDYCAPEIIECPKEGYNGAKVDAWSCGVVLYALLTGRLPFLATEPNDLYDLITECKPDYSPIKSPQARDLLSKLFVRDAAKRYDLAKVKRHPWFLIDYDGDDARFLKKAPFFNKNPSSLLSSANAPQPPSPSVTTGPTSSAAPIAPVFASAPEPVTAQPLPPAPSAAPPLASDGLHHTPLSTSVPAYPTDKPLPSPTVASNPIPTASPSPAIHAPYVPPHIAQMHDDEPRQGEVAMNSWPVPGQPYHEHTAVPPSHHSLNAVPQHARMPESNVQYEWYQPPVPAPDVDIHMSSPPPPHHEVISRVQDRPATPAKRPMSATAAAAFKAAAAAAAIPQPDSSPTHGHLPVPGSPGFHSSPARMSPMRHNGIPSMPPTASYEPAGGSRGQSPIDTMPMGGDPDGGMSSDQDSTEDYEEKPALQLELPPASRVARASPRSDFNSLRAQYLQQSMHNTSGRRYDSDLGVNTGASAMMSPVEGPSSMSSMHTHRRTFGRDGPKNDPRGLRVPLSSEVPNSPPVVYSPGVNGSTSYDRYRSVSPGMNTRHGFGSDVSSPTGSHPSVMSGYATPWHATANPYAARDDYGSTNPSLQSEIIARHLWNMISKLRGTDKPAPFKLSQELRSDFGVMVAEINQMQKKEDVAAVFTNFLNLFETLGLSDGRISPVTGRHPTRSRVASDMEEEYEDGTTIGSRDEIPSIGDTRQGGPRRVMTDMSSEEEPRSWSPVVTEAARHQSDLARRRNISDLLNKMIKKTNKAIPSDKPDRTTSFTGDDMEPPSKTDLSELNRLMQEHHGGREDAHIADEFLRLMSIGSEDSNSMHFSSTGSQPPAQLFAQTSRPVDAYTQVRYQGNMPNPSAAMRPSTPHRSHSGRMPLPSDYVPGRFKESPNISSRTDSRTHQSSGRRESSNHFDVGDTNIPSSRADMAVSMGMHDVPYYGTDKKKVATKFRSALLAMKVKNQMLGERHAQIQTSMASVAAISVLGLVLQDMGAEVRIKRETKRKMKFVMPISTDHSLHGNVQFQPGENGINLLIFGRSRQDRGRTDTQAFHRFFEEAREKFIRKAHSWVPGKEPRNSRRPRPRAATPLGRHHGDSIAQHA